MNGRERKVVAVVVLLVLVWLAVWFARGMPSSETNTRPTCVRQYDGDPCDLSQP